MKLTQYEVDEMFNQSATFRAKVLNILNGDNFDTVTRNSVKEIISNYFFGNFTQNNKIPAIKLTRAIVKVLNPQSELYSLVEAKRFIEKEFFNY